MFVYLLLLSLVLSYIWLKWNYNYWKKLGVPGPTPSFLVGNLGPVLTVSEHFGKLCQKWYKKFYNAPYIGYYKIMSPGIMIRDPELIKDVLIKNFQSFHENDFAFDEKMDPLLAHNPFLVTDEKWKEARGLLTPLFTTNKVKYMFPLIKGTCEKLTAYISHKGSSHNHDSKDLAARFTTENVATVAFSIEANCFKDTKNEFREMGKAIFQPSFSVIVKMMCVMFCPFMLKLIPVPFLPQKVNVWMRNLVAENLKSRKNIQMPHEDFLQMLLKQRTDQKHITDEQLAGHSLAFFSEGYETSSTLLCFAFYEMANNQEIQDRVRREINDVLAKNKNEFNFDALTEMSYLDHVMHETLRLHPPAMTMNKLCTQDFIMPKIPGTAASVVVKKGTPIIIPIYALHMDEAYWPDPEQFEPLRFTEENKKLLPKGVYLPFGEGPRMCMGMRFALGQTKAALASVLINFQITLSPDHKPLVLDNSSFLYDAKDGVILNFKPLKLK